MKQQFFLNDTVQVIEEESDTWYRVGDKFIVAGWNDGAHTSSKDPDHITVEGEDKNIWVLAKHVRLLSRACSVPINEDQPEAIPPSHVALGDNLVQVGRQYMKIWCDTCQGTGEIDETLGGESFSGRDTPCPDCDGKGWWEHKTATNAEIAPVQQDKKHSHYFKKCGYDYVDVYRTLKMFDVTDPCISHACKKLLVTGGRGFKDIDHDIQDVIDTLVRWQEMRKEDSDA